MQNCLVCSDIITQVDPKVQEVIGNIGIGYFNAKLELAQNTQQLEELKQELANFILDTPSNWSIKTRIEAAIKEIETFNEKARVILKTTTVKAVHAITNIYKRIVSCSRAVRSHKKASAISKTSSGDSGDPDQPEPPSPPGLARLLTPSYLISRTPKKNRYSFSWQSAPGNCRMSGGGRA